MQIRRHAFLVAILLISTNWLLGIFAFGNSLVRRPSVSRSSPSTLVSASLSNREPSRQSPPWGRLTYEPIVVSSPLPIAEYLDFKRLESDWYFPEIPPQELSVLLEQLGLHSEINERIVELSYIDSVAHRRRIPITNELIDSIPIDIRARIYTYLAEDSLNDAQTNSFRFASDSFDEWFRGSSIRPKLKERVRGMVYHQGGYLVFADLRLIVADVRDKDEMSALLQTLTRVKTFVVSLNVSQDSNVRKLTRYWGRRGRAKEVRTLLESLSLTPGGGRVDISHLLPPFARRRVYSFPDTTAGNLKIRRDCHWTAHNFYCEDGGNRLPREISELTNLLRNEYYQVFGDYRFGDVLTYIDENNDAFHSAVYIADNVVFTKNGPDTLRPWHFARIDEMPDFYPRRTKVTVRCYRSKRS